MTDRGHRILMAKHLGIGALALIGLIVGLMALVATILYILAMLISVDSDF